MLLLSAACACLGGVLLRWARVPTGLILGAIIGAGAFNITVAPVEAPTLARNVVFVGVGVMVGSLVTKDVLRQLRAALLPAVSASLLLIAIGLGIAMLLRALGVAPSGDVLATSPGAVSVLSAAAAAHGKDAPLVALFHVMRILTIVLSLPLLVHLLPADAGGQSGGQPADARAGAAPEGEQRAGAPAPAGGARRFLKVLGVVGGASAGGAIAFALGVDGAMIFGTTLGAALVTVSYSAPTRSPRALRNGVQLALGWIVGTHIQRDTLADLGGATLPALLAALLMVGGGVATALLLRRFASLPGDVLATSPGSVELLASTAIEQEAAPLQVVLFHTVRLLFVVLSLPLLLQLMR